MSRCRNCDPFRGEKKIPIAEYERRAGVIIGEQFVYPDETKK